jgi:hypothetical protein
MEMQSWARTGVLSLLFDYLARYFSNPHQWTKVWLAGSGVSYQWEASREPGDLDCLVGINYVTFRSTNTDYAGYSDLEIASMFNEGFNSELMPNTRNWEGYELTFYVNPQSDIRDINPYAAYDLIGNVWTVSPERNPQPPYSRAWEQRSNRDEATAKETISRYSSALEEVQGATNPAHRINAERRLKMATEQATTLYDDIHAGRKIAFSKIGSGYSDFNNYRWQAGKRSGVVQALRSIKDLNDTAEKQNQVQTYGVELPTADTLIRRSLRNV